MKNILVLAGKEIKSNFVTPVAFVVISGFVLLAGFFFFSLIQQYNTSLAQTTLLQGIHPSLNEWVVTPFYQTLEIVLIFLIPILTMRAIAEEKKSGNFELLITSNLSLRDIIYGKFLGLSFVLLVMLLFAGVFPFVLITFADPEVMPTVVGFLGIYLFALAFLALGIALSSFTSNQTVACILSLVAFLLFFSIDLPAPYLGEKMGAFLNYLSPLAHCDRMLRGIFSFSDLLYFLSVMSMGFFITYRALETQRWR